MTTNLDPFMQAFVAWAAETKGQMLDVGAAYGVTTLPALAAGASVIANDIDADMLAILASRAPAGSSLRTLTGSIVDGVELPENSLDGVMASRVLHLMRPEDGERAMSNICRWLKPGGKVFIVCETIYCKVFEALIPEYEKRKAAGDKWPGFVPDVRAIVPEVMKKDSVALMNTMDPDILTRFCRDHGLIVERADFCRTSDIPPAIRLDGREDAGVIARKP
jgi:SAM-dependent methyltransferase